MAVSTKTQKTRRIPPFAPMNRVARRIVPALVAGALLLAATSGRAATDTWTGGGGDANWLTGANWGGTAPIANDILNFAGLLNLITNNNFAAATQFNGITFAANAGAFTLGGNAIKLAGNVTNSSANLQTINLAMAQTVGVVYDTGAAGLTVGAAITGGQYLSKIGTGTLTLNGVGNAFTDIFARIGTVTLASGSTTTTSAYSSFGQGSGDSPTVTVNGTATLTIGGDFNISDVSGTNGVLNINGTSVVKGANTGGATYVGKSGNATGVVNQTGGSYQQVIGNDMRIGGAASAADSAAVGTWNLSGGTFTTSGNMQVGAYGTGSMYVSGTGAATTTGGYTVVGRFTGSYGLLDVTAGSFSHNVAGTALIIGEQGTGILNVRGGLVKSLGTGGVVIGGGEATAGTVGQVNLLGGTFNAFKVSTGATADSSTLNFNGGTLQAASTTTTFLTGLTNAYVFSGGAIIDTNGFSDTIGQALLAPTGSGLSSVSITSGGSGYQTAPVIKITSGGGSGATAVATVTGGVITGVTITNPGVGYTSTPTVTVVAGSNAGYAGGSGAAFTTAIAANTSGSLTKIGAGTLTLTGANTYSGGTKMNAGTLAAGSDAVLGAVPGSPATNLTFGGGAFQPTASYSLNANRTITTTATSAATFTLGANTLTIPGVITSANTGTALQTTAGDTGVLVLSGNNTFASGATIKFNAGNGVAGGIIRLTNSNALGSNPITVLNTGGNNAALAMLQLSGGITIGSNVTYSLSGHTGSATATNDDHLRNFLGNNTFNGVFDIATFGGTYYVDSADAAGTLTMGGTMKNDVASSSRGPVFYGAGNTTVSGNLVNGTGTTQLTVGDATHVNSGTVLVTGNNTYTGPTTITNGTLKIGSATAIPAATTVVNSGTVNLNGQYLIAMGSTGGLAITGLTVNTGGIFNAYLSAAGTGDSFTVTNVATTTAGKFLISALAGSTSLMPGDYTLASDTAGGLANFSLVNSNLTVGGLAYPLTLAANSTSDVLTVGAGVLGVAYWTGSQDANWNTGGGGANTNFSIDPAGTNNTLALPNSSTDVYFTANSAGNLNTVLGQDFTINTLTFTGTGTTAGTSSVTIGGPNTLTLNAILGSYPAGTGIVINAGSVAHTINANVALGGSQSWTNSSTGLLTVNGTVNGAGNALTFAGTGDQTVAGAISGTGTALTQSGTGNVTLSGPNSYTGGTTISSGTVTAGNATALGATSNNVALNGGMLNLNGQAVSQNALTMAGGLLTDNGAGSLTLSTTGTALNVGTGSNYTTATAAGTANLFFTGATGGNITKGSANGTAILTGAIDLGGVVRTIALADTGGDVAGELNLTGVVSNGGLTLANNATGLGVTMANQFDWGTLLLNNANTYAGGTNINFGRIVISNGSALGTGTVTIAQTATSGGSLAFGNVLYTAPLANGLIPTGITVGNTINLGGAILGDYAAGLMNNAGANTLTGPVTLTNASAIINVNAGSLTISGNIGQSGGVTASLTENGGSLLTLSGTNTFTGALNLNGGTVSTPTIANGGIASGIGASTNAVGNISFNTGTLQYTGASTTTDRGYTVTANGGGINTANDLTFTGQIVTPTTSATTGAFTKYGAGNLSFTNTTGTNVLDAYTGGIGFNVSNGTLTLGTLGNTTQVNTINGELAVGTTAGAGATPGALVINGGTTNVGTYVSAARVNGTTGLVSSVTLNGGILNSANAAFGFSNGLAGYNATANITLNNAAVFNDAGIFNGGESVGGTLNVTINGTAALNVDALATAGNFLLVANGGTGTFTQNGGTVTSGVSLILANAVGAVGTYNLNGGTVTAPSITRPNGTGTFNFNGGTLKASAASATFMTGLTAANVKAGGATINTNTFADTIGQALLHDSGLGATLDGGLTKIGAGVLTLTGTNTYTGGTNLNAGSVNFTTLANVGTGLITFGGGTLQWATGNTIDASGQFNTTNTGAISIDTNGNNVAFATLLGAGDTGGLVKLGTGTLTLTGAETFTGNTTITAGTLQLGDGTANNGTVLGTIADNGALIFANPNAQSVTSAITGTGTTTKTGAGTLTLSSALTQGGFFARAGNVVVDSGAVLTIGNSSVGFQSGDNATVTVQGTGSITDSGDLNISDLSGSTGTLNITGGTVKANTLYVGKGNLGAAATSGTVNQSGGAVSQTTGGGDWRIGGAGSAADANATGNYNLSGGTFSDGTSNMQIGAYGHGTMTITGGAATVGGFLSVGRYTGGVGVLDMSAGNGTMTANTAPLALIGEQGTGTLNVGGTSAFTSKVLAFAWNGGATVGTQASGTVTQTGGTITTAGATVNGNVYNGVAFGQTGNAGFGTGVYNLNGGTLNTNGFGKYGANVTATVNLNGGTVQSNGTNAAFMTGLTAANVQAGGAIINTNGFDDTVGQVLAHDAGLGATPDGGLTKNGTGTLTLTATNTYTGGTTVNAGTLALNATGADGAGALAVNGSTVMVGADNALGAGNVTLTAGTITNTAATTSQLGLGTISLGAGSSSLDFGSGNTNGVFNFSSSSGSAFTGTLSVLDWNGTPFTGAGLDQFFIGDGTSNLSPTQLSQISFTNPNGIPGIFSALQLANGEIVSTDATPEPTSIALLILGAAGFGGGALAARRRRIV
jgi:fibronectin-binding autotransporter adhesin